MQRKPEIRQSVSTEKRAEINQKTLAKKQSQRAQHRLVAKPYRLAVGDQGGQLEAYGGRLHACNLGFVAGE